MDGTDVLDGKQTVLQAEKERRPIMDLRLKLVQWTHAILSKAGRGGSFPGELAVRLDPHFIEKFKMPGIVVIVTGTNGKI